MDRNYTEQFIEEDDKVKYIRTIPVVDNKETSVELYLTKHYLTDTDEASVEKYLNHAVDAILTREGAKADADI